MTFETLTDSRKIPRRDFSPTELERIYDWIQLRLAAGGFALDDGTENALIHLLAIAKTKYEREHPNALQNP